jgi:uncharacterized protein (TIGR03086 family)
MDHVDFRPTTTALAALVRGVADDQLTGPTPCPAYSVADLLDHIGGLSLAFASAARKQELPDGGAASADGSRLGAGWRDVIASRLDDLGAAWQDREAYEGVTMAGPVEMPADQAALVALDEVTVHAWDLARATGQSYAGDPAAVAACAAFVAAFEPPPGGAAEDGGLFGPPVAVPDDAPALDRLIGATGRDPAWTPEHFKPTSSLG